MFILGLFLSMQGRSQQIQSLTATGVMQRLASADTIYIVNFWATWCIPCVQELPEFNAINERCKDKPVKLLLVSLDFKDSYPMKLQAFLEKKHIAPEVAWLSDTDPNAFIPRIDDSWEGSIPATLIFVPGRYRKFIEGQVTAGQILKLVDNLLEKE